MKMQQNSSLAKHSCFHPTTCLTFVSSCSLKIPLTSKKGVIWGALVYLGLERVPSAAALLLKINFCKSHQCCARSLFLGRCSWLDVASASRQERKCPSDLWFGGDPIVPHITVWGFECVFLQMHPWMKEKAEGESPHGAQGGSSTA